MDAEDQLRRAGEMVEAIKAGAAERDKTIQPNECPACGAYRLDGHPPEVHEHGCPLTQNAVRGGTEHG